MANEDFLRFQKNLRQTALGVKFGKQLLTNPDSLSPTQITNVLKAMGLKLPEGVQLAADAAQALTTGAAAMSALETASSISDYRQVITMSANSVRTMTLVAQKMKWVDRDTAVLLSVGTDIAAIVGSAGADVGAWMRLALTVGQESMMAQAEANMLAKKAVVEKYQERVQGEIANFTQSIKDLQDGKLGVFSFLAANVGGTQILFKQAIMDNPAFKPIVDKFPGLHFLPYGDWTWWGKGSSTTFWGEEKTSKEALTVKGLAGVSPANAVDYLLAYLILPSAASYLSAREYYLARGKADLFNVALFSLFGEGMVLSSDMDLLPEFVKLQISPYDIGERNTFEGLQNTSNNYGIITNFGFAKKELDIPTDVMIAMDKSGVIAPLLKDREAKARLAQKFSFPVGPRESLSAFDTSFNWREMHNFVAVLDFMDMVYSDPAYESFKSSSKFLPYLSMLPLVNDFKGRFLELYNKSLIRRVNVAAKLNAAYFLNAPPSKIQIETRSGNSSVMKAL